MFMDFRGDWPPQWEPTPPEPPRRLSKQGQRVVGGLVGFNILLLLFGPIAGATLLDPVIHWLLG
jgi:hypothetical protein